MLAAPRWCEILPPALRNKVLACLAMWFDVQKSIVKSVIKLDQPIVQYSRVSGLEGGDLMLGHYLSNKQLRTAGMHLLFKWVLPSSYICNFWDYLLQYTQLVDRHARRHGKTPDFESQNFFSQLNCILLLELPSIQRLKLDEPTMVIVALIRDVKATLRNGIYYYKNFGGDEVVDLSTLHCVVGRIRDRDEWAIIDQSDNVDIQGD